MQYCTDAAACIPAAAAFDTGLLQTFFCHNLLAFELSPCVYVHIYAHAHGDQQLAATARAVRVLKRKQQLKSTHHLTVTSYIVCFDYEYKFSSRQLVSPLSLPSISLPLSLSLPLFLPLSLFLSLSLFFSLSETDRSKAKLFLHCKQFSRAYVFTCSKFTGKLFDFKILFVGKH